MTDRSYHQVVRVLKFFTKPLYRIQITGAENIPSGAAIFTPNHVSQLDPVILGTTLPVGRPIRALAKESLFKAPVIGRVMRSMGHIPVYRNTVNASDALRAAADCLQNDAVVAVYPEGTIPVGDLRTLGVFKPGAARLSLMSGAPIIPIVQWGAQEALPARVKNNWRKHYKAKP